jgi:hypothetical protein
MTREEPYRRTKKRVSRGKWFFLGWLTGMISILLLILAAGLIVMKNPGIVLSGLAGKRVEKVVTRTLQTIPKETIREKHDEIIEAVRHLSYAYADDRLPPTALQDLSSRTFTAVADQQVTAEEIDDLIRSIHRYTR